ncbi:hypothetical protein B9G55_02375 [Saccharibacillus sp. O16]|nr:hypothetical protein B9G55_02375 [Saccharibacillus sp. O16]
MKKSASPFFSAKTAAASALALTSLAAPVSAFAASGDPISAQTLPLQSNDVERAHARGILLGDAQGNLGESKGLTRAEFAVLVARAFGLEMPKLPSSSYKDVAASSWASPAAEALRVQGWMSGSGNAFLPNAPVTQEQMAVVLAKALDLDHASAAAPGAELSEAELVSASAWSKKALKQVAAAGLLGVYADGVKPGQAVLRGEAASAILAASNLRPQTVQAVADGKVQLNGVTYGVSEKLSGLFAASNAQALAGAEVRGHIANGVLQSVYELELNASGAVPAQGKAEFSGNTVLSGGGSQIEGSVTVNGDFYSIQDLTVEGELTISSSVQHDFYSKGLTIQGATNVWGGDDHTVVFETAALNTLEVNKTDVRVQLKSGTKTAGVSVQSNAVIEGDTGIQIPKLTIGDKAAKVTLNANIQSVEVQGKSTLTLGSGASIGDLKLPANVSPLSVIAGFQSAADRVGKVNGQSAALLTSPPAAAPVETPVVSQPPAPTPSVPTPPVEPTPVDPAPVQPTVKKEALTLAITTAQTAVTEAVYGYEVGVDYVELNYKSVENLLVQSKVVLEDAQATQEKVDSTAAALSAETALLYQSKNYTTFTRRLNDIRSRYADYQVGSQPGQVASQEVYDAYQHRLQLTLDLNVDPTVTPQDDESLYTQLQDAAILMERNRIAWDFELLNTAIQSAEQAKLDYPQENGFNSLAKLNISLDNAQQLIALKNANPSQVLQYAVDMAVSDLNNMTSNHLNKNHIGINNPSPILPPNFTPDSVSVQSLIYDEESDSVVPAAAPETSADPTGEGHSDPNADVPNSETPTE